MHKASLLEKQVREREYFEALVRKLERQQEANPRLYTCKVVAVAALGYAYIFAVLGVAIIFTVAFAGAAWLTQEPILYFVALCLLLFDISLIASLFARLDLPGGHVLQPEEAPLLFDRIQHIASEVQSPSPATIFLTPDFNAAAAQLPRFGLFGGHKNYLMLGLPLMDALTPVQLESVLAHEYGHLSANHGKLSVWLDRLVQSWRTIMEQGEGGGNFLFSSFSNWYGPRFIAYISVLKRGEEYEADRCAALVTTPAIAAEALVSVNLKASQYAEDILPGIWKNTARQAEPPVDLFEQVAAALNAPLPPEKAAAWLNEALLVPPDQSDTHPSLAQRLEAMGQAASLPAPGNPSAAEHFLGANRAALAAKLSQTWAQEMSETWREQHERLTELTSTLEKLEAQAGQRPLTRNEKCQKAGALEELGREDEALQCYEELAQEHPKEARGHIGAARILLGRQIETALERLETAYRCDPACAAEAHSVAYSYLLKQSRLPEAAIWQERLVRFNDEVACAYNERVHMRRRDQYLPHDLAPEVVDDLRRQMAANPEVARLLVVRKKVQYLPSQPHYVVGIEIKRPKISFVNDAEKRDTLRQKALEHLELDGTIGVLFLETDKGRLLGARLKKVPGATIYPELAE